MLGCFLDSLFQGSIALHHILNRLVRRLSAHLRFHLMIRFGPTHLHQPFDEARRDSGCESYPDGQEEGLVDGVCQHCFGPDGAVSLGALGVRGFVIIGALF